jgi:hypothetical protein
LLLFNLIAKTIQKNFAHPYNPNIVKISLKRVEMNFSPGSKHPIIGKTPRKPQDMTESTINKKKPIHHN